MREATIVHSLSSDRPRVICVSNRLPVTAHVDGDALEFRPSSGGLVTALAPVLRECGGVWIGWPGITDIDPERVRERLAEFSSGSEFPLIGVPLDKDAISGFYEGFSNQVIWPLFHDLQCRCNFDPEFWTAYMRTQEIFSDVVLAHSTPADLLWIHDYQLLCVGQALRRAGARNKLCFFLHIPFPAPDIFRKLPWRREIIEALLNYDVLGFQTQHDLQNFLACVAVLTGQRFSKHGALWALRQEQHECRAGHFPISIDFGEFEELSGLPEIEEKARVIRENMNVEYLVLSMDRLDYTKGIPDRIKAFRRLLETEPGLKRRVALLQVVVPSRAEVPEYQHLLAEIERLVTEVNGMFGEPGWVPVQHLYRSFVRDEIIALYRAADVLLVLPLKDGMNLVAKEYCAARIHSDGVLILSEFAGVAEEFAEYAVLVNPHDSNAVAAAMAKAFAITGRGAKMEQLRSIVRAADVFGWSRALLNAAGWEGGNGSRPPGHATMWERLKRSINIFDL